MDHDNSNKKDNKKESNGEEEKNKNDGKGVLPLVALNHLSRLCRNVKDSIDFYTKVLGSCWSSDRRLSTSDGAWLFNYGVGIHLIQAMDGDRLPDTDHLDPMDNHISFQCEDMEAMVKRLEERGVNYMKRTVEDDENGTTIDQLFFDDPDGFMIEICNCENLKPVPARSLGKTKLPCDKHSPLVDLKTNGHQNDHARCMQKSDRGIFFL